MDITTFTLDNGLRVVHCHQPQTAMVAVDILYNTGARDETPQLTGMAHLFEHLMFGGSVNVPSFDREIEDAGGTNNAYTSSDFTCFYDVVPAQNIETVFHLESDRMLALSFNPKSLEVQRNVVIEEFKEVCLNRPYGDLMHHLRRMLYQSHPYSWPVIGIEPDHIARVTDTDVRHWFYSHYAPNNAVMAVVGNITADETRRLTEKWFGEIPRREIAQRNLTDDPWPIAEKEATVYGDVPQTAIVMAFRMDPYGTTDYFAADAITDILAAGKSSRYYRNLVLGTDIFTAADASISGSEHSGFLMLHGRLASEDDATVARARELMLNQARALAEPGNVTPYELERTKNRYEATFTFENMSIVSLAETLASALFHGEDIRDNVPRYRALTLEQIASTARRIFIDHAPATVIYRPTT